MLDNHSKRKKIDHFINLVAVACSDGGYDDVEKDFLAEKAVEFGLSNEVVIGILMDSENLVFQKPKNAVECEEQINDIIHLALIDGILRPKEYELCLLMAEKLGFDKNYVDQKIEDSNKFGEDFLDSSGRD